jgi:outer membrane protein assembly factor BamB
VSDGVISAISLTWDTLIAIDIKTGSTNWEVKLPFEQSGVRGMVANKVTIFAVKATRADAYEVTTGNIKWSTELGYGHVTVIPQLDSGLLRIYYGDDLLELDPESGKVLTTNPKDSVVWVYGNTVFKTLNNNQITVLDKQTGKSLWTKCDMCNMFDVNEGKEPQGIGRDILIVGYNDKRICALNLRTGKDEWCRPEAYISKVAVDLQSQLGYAMRSDFALVTIDMQTGNILGETRFLSSEPDKNYSEVVSVAFSDGVVVISFYDSGQTFGLSFSQ